MKRVYLELMESIRIAAEQLRAHKFRSLLTALGVIIGVLAITLMGVAIGGLNKGIESSLSMLGTDIFYVEKWPWGDVGEDWVKYRNRPNLQAKYAEEVNEIIATTPNSKLVVAVPSVFSIETVKREDRSVDGVYTNGTNSDFNIINTADLEYGRFFNETESVTGQNVVILGFDVANALFPEGREQALEKTVRIRDIKFRVIGVMERQGSFLGLQSFDNQAVIPLPALFKFFGHFWRDTTSIRIMKQPDADLEEARDEVIGAMRRARGLLPGEENNFEVNQSQSVSEQLGPMKTGITLAGFFITGLALFVGAIGIMNVTFVSVRERTKEIGTRRALGARKSTILMQFLVESVSICIVGGVVGLVLAFLMRAGLNAAIAQVTLPFEPNLVILAFTISVLTGVFSGLAPAWQAARLDPAVALHHE